MISCRRTSSTPSWWTSRLTIHHPRPESSVADAPIFRDGLLAGQTGIITGGGTGIGFGVAELLASLGMHVVLASRRAEHLEPAADRIRAGGGSASTAPLDVRDADSVKEVVGGVAEQHGRLDLLVN